MNDFDFPDRSPPRLWDLFMLPVGVDVFTAQPRDLKLLIVSGRNAWEAGQSPEALRLVRKNFYTCDVQPTGTSSAIVNQVRANARARLDTVGRLELERGETSDLVRGILGSRSLGSGW